MKALIDAVVSLIQNTPKLAVFAGQNPSNTRLLTEGGDVLVTEDGRQLAWPGTNARGPFFIIAPEGTNLPFTIIRKVPGKRYQGFGAQAVSEIDIDIAVYDSTAEGAEIKGETVWAFFDVLSGLTLAQGTCRKPLLLDDYPRIMDNGIGPQGQRVTASITRTRWRVQRTKGG